MKQIGMNNSILKVITLIFSISLLLFSCSLFNLMDLDETGDVSVSLHMVDEKSRSIIPDVASMVDSYTVTLSKGDDELSESAEVSDDTDITVDFTDVPVGTWGVSIEAVESRTTGEETEENFVIAVGSDTLEVSKNGDNSVTVTVAPTQESEGEGSLDVAVSWPADLIDEVGSAQLIPQGGGTAVDITNTDNYDFSSELNSMNYHMASHASGRYTLVIQFLRDGEIVAPVVEGVYIYDNVISAETIALTEDEIAQPPEAPTDFSAEAVDHSSVELSWTDESRVEVGYKLYRKLQEDTEYTGGPLVTLAANMTSYTDESVEEGTAYDYRLTAYNNFGETAAAEDASAETPVETAGVTIEFANPENPDITFTGTYPEVNLGSSFTVTASQDSAGCSWYLDGDEQTVDETSSPMSQAGETLQAVSIDTAGLSIGTHTVTVITDEFYSSSFSFTVISEDFVGQGTAEDPFQIRTLGDLRFLTQNSGYWDSYFVQTADIDASETQYWDDSDDDSDGDAYNDAADASGEGSNEGFLPIGNNTTPLTGSYDGGGYVISNLTIARPSADYAGLFGRSASATFRNVNLSEVNITGNRYIAALIGSDMGGDLLIENCSAESGTVKGIRYVGGIAGAVLGGGSIQDSSSEADLTIGGIIDVGGIVGSMDYGSGELSGCSVSAAIENAEVPENSDIMRIGGIAGLAGNRSSVDITGCEFDGSINISVSESNVNHIGGLAGTGDCFITDSQSGGSIDINTNRDVSWIGGLAGLIVSAVESRSGGSISINAHWVEYAGGLLGELYSDGESERSFSCTSLSISAEQKAEKIGGFAGETDGLIQDCWSRSPVSVTTETSGSYAEAGGFIGNQSGGNIKRCYAVGSLDVTAEGDNSTVSIGGFAEYGLGGSFISSFWSREAVGDYDSVIYGSGDGITKSDDTEMKTESTYTDAGWDFSNNGIWTMPGSSSINDGYPIFQYMLPQ